MSARPGDEYVALGSSFAAGPLLGRRAPGAPRQAGRTRANYAHLVAHDLGLRLVDATFSGATAADVLSNGLGGEPPQIERVGPATRLVTVTCGGNDLGYIGGLMEATQRGVLGRLVRRLGSGDADADADADAVRDAEGDLELASAALRRIAAEARRRAPAADVLFVEYLTVLPADPDVPTGRLPRVAADAGRALSRDLARITRAAAVAEGCGVVTASDASADHHAWSAEPWTNRYGISLTQGAPYHPRKAGMRAVADLVVARLRAR